MSRTEAAKDRVGARPGYSGSHLMPRGCLMWRAAADGARTTSKEVTRFKAYGTKNRTTGQESESINRHTTVKPHLKLV
ncbi:hypothetical protein [Streptomyces albiflavescens]|uniref:hypothetical protein n=1 Tax=Streptomyces albiflavescens TaxID=1623582 RepID=UPI0016645466|nr:hypothetical protein [Streptomyces albiflavescens]